MGILINQGRQIGGLSEQDQANIGKVIQTETTIGAEYELLFSETAADATTHTEEARKSQYFKFNPHNKIFTVGTRKTTELDNYTPIVTPGDYSTCLGYNVATEGDYCFSEGQNTFSAGTAAHAEGRYTHAGGNGAHAEGLYTIAWGDYQHVQGKYNIKDTNLIYAHIVGNGTSNTRSNAYALRWDGQQDVTNDIVRVDSGGTWDGFNTSLEDAFKQNLGECNNYDAYTGIYYSWYEIASFDVDPGSYDDDYQYQNDINNPIVLEVSQIVNSSFATDSTGYSVLEIAFKFDSTTHKPEILQFLSSNSLDYKLLPDLNWSNIWHLYGRYRTSTPIIKNKSILHRITGSGFHNNVTVVMQNVTDQQTISSIVIDGVSPTRNFVKTSASKDFVRNSAIAANYDNTATYEVGDLCFYQISAYYNTLYICNTAISTPEDFNSSHWTQVTLPEYFVKKSGDTMTGDFKCGNITIYAAGSNGNKNSILIGDDVTIGDCNNGGCFGMKSTGTNAGIRFFNSSGTTLGGIQSTNGTLQWIDTGGTSRNIAHSGNVGTGDSNGQVKIAGTNVSVKGLGSNAYTSTAHLPLTGGTMTGTINSKHSGINKNSNPSSAQYYTSLLEQDTNGNMIGFIGSYQATNGIIGNRFFACRQIGNTWYYHGIQLNINNSGARSVGLDDAGAWRSALGINTGYNGSWFSKYVFVGGDGVIEIGRYIDFHQTNAHSGDYTFRFNNNGNNTLQASGSISQGSSRKIKENIEDMTEEEALKILELNPVSFDYIEKYGGGKDNRGFIAEDVAEILPNLTTPEEGDIDDMKHFSPMSLNYTGMIPYLVKIVQIQQKQINTLTEKLDNLNKN